MNRSSFEAILRGVLLVTTPIAGVMTGCSEDNCGALYTNTYALDGEDGGATDGGATDGGATDGGATAGDCFELCKARGPFPGRCGFSKDADGNDEVWCEWQNICEGRRPPGLASRPSPKGASHIGRFFARASHNEAASVDAFQIVRDELRAHAAPRPLVRAAIRSARDEVRHARMTAALARRYGATVERPLVLRRPIRGLAEIALENAAEGCVRETYGALVAAWQARASVDPVVRAVMRRIARDEARHAALGWEVARWAEARLSRADRARVSEARDSARRALSEAATQEVPEELIRYAGLPRPAHARAILEELARALPLSPQ